MVPLLTTDFRRTKLEPRPRPLVRALAEALFSSHGEATRERLDAFVDEAYAFMLPASKTLRFGLVTMLHVLHLAISMTLARGLVADCEGRVGQARGG